MPQINVVTTVAREDARIIHPHAGPAAHDLIFLERRVCIDVLLPRSFVSAIVKNIAVVEVSVVSVSLQILDRGRAKISPACIDGTLGGEEIDAPRARVEARQTIITPTRSIDRAAVGGQTGRKWFVDKEAVIGEIEIIEVFALDVPGDCRGEIGVNEGIEGEDVGGATAQRILQFDAGVVNGI